MRKTKLYEVLFLVTFWVLAAVFIICHDGAVLGFEAREEGVPYDFGQTLLIGVLVTLVAGTPMAAFEVLFLSRVLRRHPYGITLMIKTVFYLSCIFIFTSLAVILMSSTGLDKPVFHSAVWARYTGYMFSAEAVVNIVYWGFIVFFSLFVLQVSEKFGQGVLLDFLLGKYHQPREEQRIFMFLDLKSSTTYAERLGHIKYSQLIQDCFFDLTDVVARHHAVIYQYVGDEVILTWDIGSGVQHGDCLQIFYAYDEALRRRGAYYEAKYGLIPKFKAGVNAGSVTVAEVGEIKKELAYHGDVLNTAARIQGKCNELGRRLLISETMMNQFNGLTGYKFGLMGNVALKGKEQSVRIYDVMRPEGEVSGKDAPLEIESTA